MQQMYHYRNLIMKENIKKRNIIDILVLFMRQSYELAPCY